MEQRFAQLVEAGKAARAFRQYLDAKHAAAFLFTFVNGLRTFAKIKPQLETIERNKFLYF
jgi:hypothetical protein